MPDVKIKDWFPDISKKNEVLEMRYPTCGYPEWFGNVTKESINRCYGHVPRHVDVGHKLAPYILRLQYRGWPIWKHSDLGWGYILNKTALVNGQIDVDGNYIDTDSPNYNFQNRKNFQIISLKDQSMNWGSFLKSDGMLMPSEISKNQTYNDWILEEIFGLDIKHYTDSRPFIGPFERSNFKGNVPDESVFAVYELLEVPDSVFIPMPHPSGELKKCGNPLSLDYNEFLIRGLLVPTCGPDGFRASQLVNTMTFWKNNRLRISHQSFVCFDENDMPLEYGIVPPNTKLGAILPRVIPAGTVTRRAVEVTWLTAINPSMTVTGSELKSSIRAPPGFCFVGADVDSEELWIASVITDAAIGGFHGSTPFSYMNVQGTKDNGTDLHSVTAKAIGITRNHAKVLNYGRIYGGSENLTVRMLQKLLPNISLQEAIIKTVYLYNFTKGIVRYELTTKGLELLKEMDSAEIEVKKDLLISRESFFEMRQRFKIPLSAADNYAMKCWVGGSESELFNILERLSQNPDLRTPILNVLISKPMDPEKTRKDFLKSRMNWVIQSSAVDFLHVFLVCCYWLFSLLRIPARTSICIHDEIRFLVPQDKRYEAAFVMHIANLYTRSLFSQRLGIHDLPQRVAFFSAVDIDFVLRKEVTLKCTTPSNPTGVKRRSTDVFPESLNIYQVLEKVNQNIFTVSELEKIKESTALFNGSNLIK